MKFRSNYQSEQYKSLFRKKYWGRFAFILIFWALGFVVLWIELSQRDALENRALAERIAAFTADKINEWDELSYNLGRISAFDDLRMEKELIAPESYQAARQEMVTYMSINHDIQRMAVYTFGAKYVVTSSGIVRAERYWNSLGMPENQNIKDYAYTVDEGDFFRHASMDKRERRSIYVLPLVDEEGEKYGILFLTIRDEVIKRDIEDLSQTMFSYIVYDWDEHIIVTDLVANEANTLSFDEIKETPLYRDNYEKVDNITCFARRSTQNLMIRRIDLGVAMVIVLIIAAVILVPMTDKVCAEEYAKQQETDRRLEEKALEAARNKREMELAKASERMKSDFLSRMSHDIRTPMNGIIGLIHILKENQDNPEIIADSIFKLEMASEQLQLLLNDILDMSRLENKKETLSYHVIETTKMFRSCLYLIEAQAAENNITITTHVEQNIHPYIISSSNHTNRIAMNILNNAVKYNRPGGSLDVYFSEEPIDSNHSYFILRVVDTGIGMSEEFLQHVYEPFERENTESRPGSGLGMAITKELVELMGGTISIKSKLGVGTEVETRIPLEIVLEKPKEEKREELTSLHGLHILLAEDNELNRQVALYILQESGAEVTCVKNGEEAVRAFEDHEEHYLDVILMDVMMPVMDGLQASAKIRSLSRKDAVQIPIIAVSANASEKDIAECLEAGMNHHISKPIVVSELLAILKAIDNERD